MLGDALRQWLAHERTPTISLDGRRFRRRVHREVILIEVHAAEDEEGNVVVAVQLPLPPPSNP